MTTTTIRRLNTTFFKLLTLLSTIYLMSTLSSAANITRTDTISITVQVAERTLVDINPAAMSWTGGDAVDPGSTGVMKGFQIENIGSTNISYIWFNTTFPTTRPFGSGNPALYDPANFVQIKKNETIGSYFFYVNRVDFNETRPIYVTLAAGCTTVGRFREGGEEFFWCLDPAGNGQCNNTGAAFYIGKTAHNQTQTGTVDFSGSCDAGLKTMGGNDCRTGNIVGVAGTGNGWGWTDVAIGANNIGKNYSLAVNYDCTTLHFSHWNMDEPGATEAGNEYAEYFRTPATGVLAPGGSAFGDVQVKVPYGVPFGTLPSGVLTVIAMAVDVNA